ncbi:MAG: hypothetical protein RBS56_04375 [Candidatus Gracilibacteria bacterium]|jgi:hypothetical protein|nr:hypothetical protein [Candidatus Gracilibacteria bacterium]
MKNLKNKNPGGFISIVAMMIFAILVITGLSVQRANIDRLQNIRNTLNYSKAKNVSKSVIGRLQQLMDEKGPGYNFKAHCEFSGGDLSKENPEEYKTFCRENFLKVINPCTIDGNQDPLCKEGSFSDDEIVIDAEIKGRNETPVTSCTYMPGGTCYTVPALGEGTAGDREWMPVKNDLSRDCDLYTPTGTGADLDHECNWNRLSFGSTATDRVVIPLYYTDDDGNVVDFSNDPSITTHFILRVRTPCKAWNENTDECSERYELYTGENYSENDIVLQWQITGTCLIEGTNQECGLLPWLKLKPDGSVDLNTSSSIHEFLLNLRRTNNFIVLISDSMGSSKSLSTISYSEDFLFKQLLNVSLPNFNLFLNKSLYDIEQKSIPYLEYQFLTPSPISNPKAKIENNIIYNGNSSSSIIEQSVSGALIDFAIQN